MPLSTAVMHVLSEALEIAGRTPLVFPARRGGTIADTTLSRLLRDLRIGAVPHGFRSSFRDWAAERTSAPHAVMEAALAHAVSNKVEAAYFRSSSSHFGLFGSVNGFVVPMVLRFGSGGGARGQGGCCAVPPVASRFISAFHEGKTW